MNPVKIHNGNFLLKDQSFIFIKSCKNVKVIKTNQKLPYERIIFCDRCLTTPAIQLDSQYKKDIHDFTLCERCIKELSEIKINREV